MTYVRGLVCRECGRGVPESPIHVCEFCFGPLEVDYDYAAIRALLTRDRIEAGPPSIWRYKDLLPLDGQPLVGHHVGLTPLVRARNLEAAWGLRELYLKNDAVCHPTWSFKDRVVSVAISKARELGLATVACASTGNLAHSVSAHAAAAGLPAVVFIPAGLEMGKVLGTQIYGGDGVRGGGTYDDVNWLCSELDRHPWAFVNVNLRPYHAEGSKTVGYGSPAAVAPSRPVVVRAAGRPDQDRRLAELTDLGLVEGRLPGCTRPRRPAAAHRDHDPRRADVLVPVRLGRWPSRSPSGIRRWLLHQAVRESGGWAAHATDDEIVEATELLARTEDLRGGWRRTWRRSRPPTRAASTATSRSSSASGAVSRLPKPRRAGWPG
jgi:threonine synthase